MRKIAIVGFSQRSREDAPFDDPTFEIWGMNNLHAVLPGKRFTRWYDIHSREYLDLNNKNLQTDHVEWLRTTKIPVYMLREYKEFPTSLPYPLEDVQDMMRTELGFQGDEDRYLHSTPAMALAHAVLEGVDEVEIYGCDMVVDLEWGYQRANMEAWVTLARQLPALSGGKIKVTVAQNCALLKGMGLYAYDAGAYSFMLKVEDTLRSIKHEAETKKQDAESERFQKQVQMNTFDGSRQAMEHALEIIAQMKRGYQV